MNITHTPKHQTPNYRLRTRVVSEHKGFFGTTIRRTIGVWEPVPLRRDRKDLQPYS